MKSWVIGKDLQPFYPHALVEQVSQILPHRLPTTHESDSFLRLSKDAAPTNRQHLEMSSIAKDAGNVDFQAPQDTKRSSTRGVLVLDEINSLTWADYFRLTVIVVTIVETSKWHFYGHLIKYQFLRSKFGALNFFPFPL